MQSGSITLQERALALLRGLFESRIMTAEHIAPLYFDSKTEATKKRLQKLKAAGLIGERRRKAFEPAVLFLTRNGFDALREKGKLADYPQLSPRAMEKRADVSAQTLRHEIEIMDVKAAFCAAIRGTDRFTVAEFSTWPLLYQFEAYRPGHSGANVLVKPDGFIRIHEKEPDGGLSEHTFFLEVDRSNETREKLVAKAGCYLDYYRSGGFAEKNGAPRSVYKEYPFRVLIVLQNGERRNNTAERLLQNTPPILTQVWLSTLAEVTATPLAAIWISPADYRDATRGTPFDTEHAPVGKPLSRVEWVDEIPPVINAPLDFQLKGLDQAHPYLQGRGLLATYAVLLMRLARVFRLRSAPEHPAPAALAAPLHLRAVLARRDPVAVAFKDFLIRPSNDGSDVLRRFDPRGKLRFKRFKIRHGSLKLADNVRPLGVAC